ncbi:cys-tRNA(pro)/cys-tRNA(cys) deacylase [Comamonas serinivorans]|uniref:Cys-tRNA(Pro)/cys-tRNA(Cys) deacylase n=1 Tax=Comamonas serinivorans TaxID=1082851 RepID=A0A1Y0EQH3_9BURK|nr:YbaK/EbsC family protein [Comamonas serinivorans]ARU05826.1 cys-tRNA(pro)/cys-tRNA(cys) deacylase [Comamonas serinivorans]
MCGAELLPLPDGVQRVARWLAERGHADLPQMLNGAARTAQQAADALGVQLGQIAKSIIFRRQADDAAVLVVTSGDLRVDEAQVAARVGPIGRADAAFVKAATGFSIGGVAPVAHQPAAAPEGAAPLVVLVDEQLARFDTIWAAAGHPHAVFRLTVDDLVRWTGQPAGPVTQAAA